MIVSITSLLCFANSALLQKQHKLFWKLDTFLSWGDRVRRPVLSSVRVRATVNRWTTYNVQ